MYQGTLLYPLYRFLFSFFSLFFFAIQIARQYTRRFHSPLYIPCCVSIDPRERPLTPEASAPRTVVDGFYNKLFVVERRARLKSQNQECEAIMMVYREHAVYAFRFQNELFPRSKYYEVIKKK